MNINPKDYSSFDMAVELAQCLTLKQIEKQCKRFLNNNPIISRTYCVLCNDRWECDDCVYDKFVGNDSAACGCIEYSKQYGVIYKNSWKYLPRTLEKTLERYCMAYLLKGDE